MEVIGITESTVQYLRVHIITGELAPGQKLNEMELSSRLHISRPPLHEAFRIEDHGQVLDLIKRGDYVEAREFLRAHINSFLKFIEEAIAEKSADLTSEAAKGLSRGQENPSKQEVMSK